LSSAIRTTKCRISASTPRGWDRRAWVHLQATSCRCHRSRVSGVTIVATWRKGLPSQPPGRRSVVGRHLSDAGVAHPAALAGRDSLQSGTRVPQAPDDPTSRSRLRTTSGEPTCRSRRESISRNEESADHRSRSTRGIIRAHDSTGHDISRPPALAIAARVVSGGWLADVGGHRQAPCGTRGATRADCTERRAPTAAHLLFSSRDAGRAGPRDSGARGPSGSHDDAAVHAPQSRCSRQCDPVARPPLEYPGVLETSCWRRRRPNPLSPTRSVI